MKKVTLLFLNEEDLRRFASIIKCSNLEMNKEQLTLVCECDEAEIELAENGFHAQVTRLES